MREATVERVADDVKSLRTKRNDTLLLRARDRMVRIYTGPFDSPFWELVHRFDDIVIDRRHTGELRRYALAQDVLSSAADQLCKEQPPE